jgi:ribosomal protein L14
LINNFGFINFYLKGFRITNSGFSKSFEAVPNMPVKRSDVIKAVIVRTVKGLRRESGMSIRFDDNAAIIINADGSPKGSVWLTIFSIDFKYMNE